MRGFPKWFNTRADVDTCLAEYPEQMKTRIKEWHDDRYCWQPVGELTNVDVGVDDATHKVEARDDGTVWQLELVEDLNNHLTRLGITVEEAQGMVG